MLSQAFLEHAPFQNIADSIEKDFENKKLQCCFLRRMLVGDPELFGIMQKMCWVAYYCLRLYAVLFHRSPSLVDSDMSLVLLVVLSFSLSVFQ